MSFFKDTMIGEGGVKMLGKFEQLLILFDQVTNVTYLVTVPFDNLGLFLAIIILTFLNSLFTAYTFSRKA